MHTLLLTLIAAFAGRALGQGNQSSVPNTFPHAWPGQPNGTFSPEWQDCTYRRKLLSFVVNASHAPYARL